MDVVLVTDDVPKYVTGDAWIRDLGAVGVIRTPRWGVLIERRLADLVDAVNRG